jgi:hypothetical protein
VSSIWERLESQESSLSQIEHISYGLQPRTMKACRVRGPTMVPSASLPVTPACRWAGTAGDWPRTGSHACRT